ncbi:Carboxypeptidase B2 [Porphyridium purpureum]|uniref:Carboxypeptidase B2 n=1 Tax=Porphyridium purpureum TaxID=35688 RepID=A0A5J4Z0Y5_PORPP|nr:Carboxypeptidase B2 [Porphyridium purpureum]|eukprot:POR4164..scf208_2
MGHESSWPARLPSLLGHALMLVLAALSINRSVRAVIATQILLEAAAGMHQATNKELMTAVSLSFAKPDWTLYSTYDAQMKFYRELNDTCAWVELRFEEDPKSRLDSESLTNQSESRNGADMFKRLPVLLITESAKEPRALNGKMLSMLVAGTHGRELITSEIVMQIAATVCEHSSGTAFGLDPDMTRMWRSLLADVAVVLVPVLNEYGMRDVENGNLCSRGNARQVDLNRNFDFLWGRHDESTNSKEENPGPFAESEPETRALIRLARRLKPQVFLSLHSGDRALMLPYDYTKAPPALHRLAPIRDAAQQVARSSELALEVGSCHTLFRYNAYGTTSDYFFEILRVPFVLTVEVFGDGAAHEDDCHRMFNPINASEYVNTVSSWSGGIRLFLELAKDRLNGASHGGGRTVAGLLNDKENAEHAEEQEDVRTGSASADQRRTLKAANRRSPASARVPDSATHPGAQWLFSMAMQQELGFALAFICVFTIVAVFFKSQIARDATLRTHRTRKKGF